MASDAIGFNYIPGSGLTAPLFGFEVNSGGQPDGQTALIYIAHATSAGRMTPLRAYPVASQNDVDYLAGGGSMLREMYRIGALNAPVQPIKIMALPEVGIVEVRTLTLGTLSAPASA